MNALPRTRADLVHLVRYSCAKPDGNYVLFRGTREQLIAAGVAFAEMFDGIGELQTREGFTDIGVAYGLRYMSTTDTYEFSIRTYDKADVAERIHTAAFRRRVAWREHGAAIEAEVAIALYMMRRPRRNVSPNP